MHFHTSLNRTGLNDLFFFFAVVIKSISENEHKEEQTNRAGVVKQSACKPAGRTLPGRQLAWWAGGEAWALTLITSWPWANASCHKLDVLRGGQPSGQPCRHPWAYWTKLYRTHLLANSYKLPEHKVSSSNCLILPANTPKLRYLLSFLTRLVQYASKIVNLISGNQIHGCFFKVI